MDKYLIPRWRRNQVESALWRYMAAYPHWGEDKERVADAVPRRFSSQVRKLLNLDRDPDLSKGAAFGPAPWVFFEDEGQGRGSEELFGDYHVFLLGFALDLWNLANWKQTDVILFMRHVRNGLLPRYKSIRSDDGRAPVWESRRQPYPAEDFPDALTFAREGKDKSPVRYADFTRFVVIQRTALVEMYSKYRLNNRAENRQDAAIMFSPKFVPGLQALAEEFHRRPNEYRTSIVIEVADMARALPVELAKVAPVGRGRPKS